MKKQRGRNRRGDGIDSCPAGGKILGSSQQVGDGPQHLPEGQETRFPPFTPPPELLPASNSGLLLNFSTWLVSILEANTFLSSSWQAPGCAVCESGDNKNIAEDDSGARSGQKVVLGHPEQLRIRPGNPNPTFLQRTEVVPGAAQFCIFLSLLNVY